MSAPQAQQLLLPRSLDERFRAFHRDNPEVYATLLRLARQAKARGQRVGIRCLWERMRWELFVEVRASGDFRLNDNLTSRYARLLSQEPDLRGFFELRELRS